MSDTPKTDAVANAGWTGDSELVDADFCRKIERECGALAEQVAKTEQLRLEEQQGRVMAESEIKKLREEIKSLTAERGRLEELAAEQRRLAETRHSVIAAAVLETVRDRAATWDEASEELVWAEGRGCQNISAEHLEATCVRYPQWAQQLRSFYDAWNKEERITPDMIAEIEFEISPEETEMSWRQTKRILDFYAKLRDAELRLEAAENALENCRLAAARRCRLDINDGWTHILRFCEEGRAKGKPARAPFTSMDERGEAAD